ncbi:MAG: hypothetical protein ABI852_09790 [Gemmatimonadaceae bacterium]
MNISQSIAQLLTHPATGLVTLAFLTVMIAPNATRITVESDSARLSFVNGVTLVDQHLLNGHVIERFADGTIKRDAAYRHGKLQGATRGWHMNGKPDYVRTYLDGIEEGTHEGWYDNGSRRFEYNFVHGVSQGVSKQWYSNGKPYTLFHFDNGQESGQQQMWDTDGKLRANYIIRDGRRYGLPGSLGCRGAS